MTERLHTKMENKELRFKTRTREKDRDGHPFVLSYPAGAGGGKV